MYRKDEPNKKGNNNILCDRIDDSFIEFITVFRTGLMMPRGVQTNIIVESTMDALKDMLGFFILDSKLRLPEAKPV